MQYEFHGRSGGLALDSPPQHMHPMTDPTFSIRYKTSYTKLYKVIQSYTKFNKGYTKFNKGYTKLYKVIQSYTKLYKVIQGFTMVTQGFTRARENACVMAHCLRTILGTPRDARKWNQVSNPSQGELNLS